MRVMMSAEVREMVGRKSGDVYKGGTIIPSCTPI